MCVHLVSKIEELDWVVALVGIIRLLLEFLRKLWRPKPPHSETNATNTGCATVDYPSFHRPDPVIYSQKYLLSLGLAATWDNPDIALFKNGVQIRTAATSQNHAHYVIFAD